jgi:RecA/RadA recombinase
MSDEVSEVKNLDEEILNNIKLKDVEEPKVEKVKRKKAAAIFAKPDETTSDETAASEELYADFKSFLQKKTDIVPEVQDFKQTMKTGIDLLDGILGGGFAIGALNIIVGQPGSGKSMLAMQALAAGQQQYKGRLLGSYLDSEESTSKVRLMNLGVRYPAINPYVDLTIEKVFQFIEGMCVFKQEREILDIPSVIIWDSVANTLSQKEREAEDPKTVIGYKARLLSLLIPTYVAKCSRNNICLLAINQLRDNLQLGQYAPAPDLKMLSPNKEMPGGNALKFNAFQLLEMKVRSVLNPEKHYGFDGIMTKVKCVKNKMFSPNIEIDLIGSFQTGFSNFWTNYHFLSENKRIEGGAWPKLVNLTEKKFRKQDAEDTYNSDAEFKTAFDELVKKTIQEEIVEKYKS